MFYFIQQLKELDNKFSEFEMAAIQRENDYKQIIEQQRLDSEQLKGFEKLKESNMEMKSVIKSYTIITVVILIKLISIFRKSKKFKKIIKFSTVPQKRLQKGACCLEKKTIHRVFNLIKVQRMF